MPKNSKKKRDVQQPEEINSLDGQSEGTTTPTRRVPIDNLEYQVPSLPEGSSAFSDMMPDPIIAYGDSLENEIRKIKMEQERLSDSLDTVLSRLDSITSLLHRNYEESKAQKAEIIYVIKNQGKTQVEAVRETISTTIVEEIGNVTGQMVHQQEEMMRNINEIIAVHTASIKMSAASQSSAGGVSSSQSSSISGITPQSEAQKEPELQNSSTNTPTSTNSTRDPMAPIPEPTWSQEAHVCGGCLDIEIEKFKGARQEDNFEMWLDRIESVMWMHGMSDSNRVAYLSLHLAGYAKNCALLFRMHTKKNENVTYSELRNELLRIFGPSDTREELLRHSLRKVEYTGFENMPEFCSKFLTIEMQIKTMAYIDRKWLFLGKLPRRLSIDLQMMLDGRLKGKKDMWEVYSAAKRLAVNRLLSSCPE